MSETKYLERMKGFAQLMGLDPADVAAITGHSWRSGGTVDYLDAGVPDEWLRRQGRWKSGAYRIYYRPTARSLMRTADTATRMILQR